MVEIRAAFDGRETTINNENQYINAEIPYFVFDTTDEEAAIDYAWANTPEFFNGLQRTQIEIDERISETVVSLTVYYESKSSGSPGGTVPAPVSTFSTSGGLQHITQSKNTINSYPPTAEDYKGAIGYDGENVQGVDITVPVFNFSETRYYPNSVVTNAFKANLGRKTGKINSNSFRSYDPGEVLFLGAEGQRQGDSSFDLWEITYQFAVQENRQNFEVGDITVTALKKGWDYLWVRYAKSVGTNEVLKRPVAVYIERVYEETDFSTLGL